MGTPIDISRSNDVLFQPFQLKHLTLKNRIMITSHEPAYAENGLPKERYRAYHVERAKGGIAMTMTAGSASVSKDSPPAFNNLLAYKDEIVPWLQELTDAIHRHDCAAMIQLSHLGRRTGWDKGDWLPSVAPTRRREPAHMYGAKLVEDWDLDRIVDDYVSAAQRMKAGGMDGIEFEAYGHLLDQFWSPATNQLQNEYGGSLENRTRLLFRVLSAVRHAVGPNFILGVRMVADEMKTNGLPAQEGLEIAKQIKRSGLVDFLNIIRGHIDTDAGLTDVIPVQDMASSPHLNFAGSIRRELDFPIFHAAKIADIATARHAIDSGLVDMVGMTRAHIADPHIVSKVLAGREDEIRPCVGATYCLDRIYLGEAALCIHNPSTGREMEQPLDIAKAESAKKIVIVGAGPGGLEAARVAAERGHNVVIFEAANEAGGQIRLAVQSEFRNDLIGIIDWRLDQCERLGVDLRFNVWAEANNVIAENPDVVIIATGGLPENIDITAGENHSVSAWDIISGDVKPGSSVLIYDETGDYAALQVAETLTRTGARVDMITPDRTLSRDVMGMNLAPYMRRLQRQDITFKVAQRLLSLTQSGNNIMATIGTDYSDHTYQKVYDQVIVNQGLLPMDALYFELKPQSSNKGKVDYERLIEGIGQPDSQHRSGQFQLYRIGDAVSARNIHAAIYDALRLVRTI